MTYQELTIIYKTYVITRIPPYGHLSFRAESSVQENVTMAVSYQEMIAWIDLLWDGKDPEMYFSKY